MMISGKSSLTRLWYSDITKEHKEYFTNERGIDDGEINKRAGY